MSKLEVTKIEHKKPRPKVPKGTAVPYRRAAEKDGEKNYWGVSWTAKLPDGTSKRIVLCAKTEEEIIAKRDAKIQELAKGEYVSRNGTTFGIWSDKWLGEYKKESLSPTTYDKYWYILKNHIKPRLGNVSLQKITNSDIQRCINLINKSNSTSVVRDAYSIINQCFVQAQINRLVSFNPAEHINMPKAKPKAERKVFTEEELKKLLEVAKREHGAITKKTKEEQKTDGKVFKEDKGAYINPVFYPALVLMIETGCRRAEILGLKWKNVTDSTITIHDTIVDTKGGAFEKPTPKNSSSVRTIPITQYAVSLLEKIKGKCPSNCPYVFYTKQGKPLHPKTFNRMFKKWCDEAEINHTPHELRHTMITDMVDAGESIATIQAISGHATPRVLLSEYTHKVQKSVNDAVSKRQERLYQE